MCTFYQRRCHIGSNRPRTRRIETPNYVRPSPSLEPLLSIARADYFPARASPIAMLAIACWGLQEPAAMPYRPARLALRKFLRARLIEFAALPHGARHEAKPILTDVADSCCAAPNIAPTAASCSHVAPRCARPTAASCSRVAPRCARPPRRAGGPMIIAAVCCNDHGARPFTALQQTCRHQRRHQRREAWCA